MRITRRTLFHLSWTGAFWLTYATLIWWIGYLDLMGEAVLFSFPFTVYFWLCGLAFITGKCHYDQHRKD